MNKLNALINGTCDGATFMAPAAAWTASRGAVTWI